MTLIKPGSTIGIIGGGQLGRMAALAAAPLGYKVFVYSDHENSPASHVVDETIVAGYEDKAALDNFAKLVDVVTFEFENIPYESMRILEESVIVRPGWKVLHTAQNRLREKDFINSIGIKTAPYHKITSADELEKAYKAIGTKCILKTIEFGYDGKGQFVIDNDTDLSALWNEINIGTGILEGMVSFTKEISVIVARDIDGKSEPYIPVENIHKSGILDITIAPAEVPAQVSENAKNIACKIADSLELVGMLAVEMFVTNTDEILVNEIAPRPHNSGHWTMDACITGQFEQFIRAVCGLPLGNPDYHSKAKMKNLIGDDVDLWAKYIADPNSKLHLYGKKHARPGRKMGHVTTLTSL
jgi:5-(carboxyamino)imidazole ribonucleotide synthase